MWIESDEGERWVGKRWRSSVMLSTSITIATQESVHCALTCAMTSSGRRSSAPPTVPVCIRLSLSSLRRFTDFTATLISYYIKQNHITSSGATPPWLRPASPCVLLCFGNSVNRKYFDGEPALVACVLKATTKKVVNFFLRKNASGWPGWMIFWPRNDLAPLLATLAPPL